MKRKIQVMLVEDHPEYREVVELALSKEDDLELISEFGTAERALRSLQYVSGTQIPDILLLDLNLPGMSGLDSIPLFNEVIPNTKIIILTQSNREADILQSIRLGASGYLLKSSRARNITDGIRSVNEGGSPLDNNVASFILSTLKEALPKKKNNKNTPELSQREMEVLTLLANGHLKKQIADKLEISTNTVVTHVRNIYEKLNAPNAPAAINQAHLQGLFKKNP